MSESKYNSLVIKKLLVLFCLVGLTGGGLFGFMIAFVVLGLYYNFAVSILFSLIVAPFFIWSFWIRCRRQHWYVICRNFILIYFIACFLNAMFTLEEGLIAFSRFDWFVIFISLTFSISIFTIWLVLEEFFSSSKVYKELMHFYKGMKIVGLIPNFEENKKDAGIARS